MTSNPRILFAKIPDGGLAGLPIPGKDLVLDKSRTIDLDTVPLNGGFLTKTLFLSPEPALRERMRDPSISTYTTPFVVGAPIVGFGLVKVLRSEKEGVNAGDYMYGQTPWEAYTVQPYIEGRVNFKAEEWAPGTFDMDSLALQVVPNPAGAFPATKYAGALGTPGLTAFVGFEGLVNAKEGETIFVSSGASGVGSMVIQFAKIKGMRVIASAGSDAKVEYMRSLGADVAFNYKKESYEAALAKNGPINVFWDNVGGEALEAAIHALLVHGLIVACGSSADYGLALNDRYGVKNLTLLWKKRLTVRGFLVPDLIPAHGAQFFSQVPGLLATGKIKSEEYIVEGLENAPQAFIDAVLRGTEQPGKPVVVVATD